MKRLLAIFFILFSLNLYARDINSTQLKAFSIQFKAMLSENSHSGFFCYISPNERRILGCNDAEKIVNLGTSSNIITNYLAYKLEKSGKFKADEDIRNYAKIFKYNAKKITFSDLISSTASLPSSLDKIYPKDAQEYEYFEFLYQMSPSLLADSDYDFSKFSNLGAIYALSYSQSKKENALISTFKSLVEQYLAPEFPSIKLLEGESPLDISFSLNIIDLATYLAKESESFSAKSKKAISKGKAQKAWLFSELNMKPIAMSEGQGEATTLVIANFYNQNIAVAIFIDAGGAKARTLAMASLQAFASLF